MSYRNGEGRDRPASADWVSDIRVSLGFLTRLPVAFAREPDAGGLASSMRAFPLAGAVVGLLSGFVLAIASGLGCPPPVAALLAVTAGVLATGGLHEDGFADTADGLGGGRTREDALAIMRDSRIGSFGVIALVLALGLKAAALASIVEGFGGVWAGLAALVACAAGSRSVLPALLHALPPARADGLGFGAGSPSRMVAAQAAVVAWLVGLLALWPYSILLGLLGVPLACAMGAAAVGAIADRRIGGHTGDIAGAAQMVSETLSLILCAAVLSA